VILLSIFFFIFPALQGRRIPYCAYVCVCVRVTTATSNMVDTTPNAFFFVSVVDNRGSMLKKTKDPRSTNIIHIY
jgi:hypothetical protein